MKNSIKKELTSISPFLASIKKQEKIPPDIPENYFASMQKSVLSKINDEEKIVKSHQSSSFFTRRVIVGMAASLALLLGVGLYFFNTPKANTIQELTQHEIQNYIENHIEEFDLAMLEEFAVGENENITIFDEIDDEIIFNYVNEQIDDFDDTFYEESF